MKVNTVIGFNEIKMTQKHIDDTYIIEQVNFKFVIYSENGYNCDRALPVFSDLEKAIKEVKNIIKNYFKVRGEENPKGF